MDINYEDERFNQVENEKNQQLNSMNNAYDNIVNQTDQFYQNQINAINDYSQKQQELQQANTDLAINRIENQKQDATKDYQKEQKASYVDWQKQSNQYGVNAEQMAASGLQNSGYSESSQVAMYNQYQNRVATAREGYNKAMRDYDIAIKDSQLQNSSALAEIAFNALKTKLDISLQGFQYKNSLLLDQVNKQQEIDNIYYNRYQDVLNQINTENSMKEQIRQYNESQAFKQQQYDYQKEQDALAQANWEKEYQFKVDQAAQDQSNWERQFALSQASKSGGGSSGGSSGSSSNQYVLTDGNSSSSNILKNLSNTMKSAAKAVGQASQPTTVNDLQMKTIKANWNKNKDVNMLVAYCKQQGFNESQIAYIEKQLGIK